MSAESPGAAEATPSLTARVLDKLWRETTRPFRVRTWRKWAGMPPPKPAPAKRDNRPAAKQTPKPRRTIPSMITHAEAEFFARCAERSLGIEGQIVDLGCWMGSTAVALASGIHRGDGQERVLAYDMFQWQAWMEREHAKLLYCVYRPGDSFLPEARRIVREHGHGLVELRPADLTAYHWPGEPIKLLLVDAMKSLPLVQQISRTFFPSLVPGALVLHQDFKHRFTPWIHLLHFRLRHHFRFLESVQPGGTVGFEVTGPMKLGEVEAAGRLESIAPEEVDAAFAFSLSLLPPEQQWDVAAAHVVYYCRHNQPQHVRRVAEGYVAQELAASDEQREALEILVRDAASESHASRAAAAVGGRQAAATAALRGYAPRREPEQPAAQSWPACDYFVMPQRRLLYAPIQKAACSSIKLWWAEAADGWLGVDPEGMNAEASRKQTHFALSQRFVYTRHAAELGDDPLTSPDWFRFTFVRNPWSRLVSAFVNKFITLTDHGTLLIDEFRERTAAHLPAPQKSYFGLLDDWYDRFTFHNFVDFLGDCDLSTVDLHWRPQTEFLAGTEFDFIGRIERLEQDFAVIRERIGVQTPLRLANVTTYRPYAAAPVCVADWPLARLRQGPVPHYRAFFTPDLVEKVARLYAADVERFGYAFDGSDGVRPAAADRRAA